MKNLHGLAAGLAIAYGLVSLVGGIIGYVSKGSLASLVAGGIAGCVLIGAGSVLPRKPKAGLYIALVLSVVLVARFISAAAKSGPSAIAIVMILGGSAVAIIAGVAIGKLKSHLRASP